MSRKLLLIAKNITFIHDFLSQMNFKQQSKESDVLTKKQLQTKESTELCKLSSCEYDVSKMRGRYVRSDGSTNTLSDGRALSVLLTSEPGRIHWWLTSKPGGGNALASRGLVPPSHWPRSARRSNALASHTGLVHVIARTRKLRRRRKWNAFSEESGPVVRVLIYRNWQR